MKLIFMPQFVFKDYVQSLLNDPVYMDHLADNTTEGASYAAMT
jgi:hypothetical protein